MWGCHFDSSMCIYVSVRSATNAANLINPLSPNSDKQLISPYSITPWSNNYSNVLIFNQTPPTSNIRNIRRIVRRIWMLILGIKGPPSPKRPCDRLLLFSNGSIVLLTIWLVARIFLRARKLSRKFKTNRSRHIVSIYFAKLPQSTASIYKSLGFYERHLLPPKRWNCLMFATWKFQWHRKQEVSLLCLHF